MKFKNLEMSGFKSFSERTTVLIEKGLTENRWAKWMW